MGLHRTVRYQVSFSSETEMTDFVEKLHDAMSCFIYQQEKEHPEVTVKFARHFSQTFNVYEYSDDEIFHIIVKFIDRKRKES